MAENPWATAVLQQGCCALLEAATPWLRILGALLGALVVLTIANACMLTAILLKTLRPCRA